MMLALHILLKDLRRHRWEIALYLVSIAGWSTQEAHPNQWIRANASALFPIVMFVVWFLLIIRVVQGESLIGTREFWTTRPYRAGSLAAAKFAFLILCLHVPLFLAQCWLLNQAGFAVTSHTLLRLVLLQIEFFSILTLPAAALASITRSIVQWVLAIIGAVLLGFVISWLPWGSLTPSLEGTEFASTAVGFILIAALLIGLLLWQYNRRGLLAARVLFGAALLAVPLCIVIASTSLARLVAYPANSTDVPIHLAVISAPDREYSRNDYSPDVSNIQFSVEGASTSPDLVAVIEGMRLQFAASDGWVSESRWTKENITLSPEEGPYAFAASIPARDADKIAAAHASAGAELAIAIYRLGPLQHIDTSKAQFDIADIGNCKWSRGGDIVRYNTLECAAPVRFADVYRIVFDSEDNTCSEADHSAPLPAGHRAEEIQVQSSDLPVEFDPNPIRHLLPDMGMAPSWLPFIPNPEKNSAEPYLRASICYGTPLNIRTGRFSQRVRVTIPLGDLGKENRTPMQLGFHLVR